LQDIFSISFYFDFRIQTPFFWVFQPLRAP
jgi:hypothetical protein